MDDPNELHAAPIVPDRLARALCGATGVGETVPLVIALPCCRDCLTACGLMASAEDAGAD